VNSGGGLTIRRGKFVRNRLSYCAGSRLDRGQESFSLKWTRTRRSQSRVLYRVGKRCPRQISLESPGAPRLRPGRTAGARQLHGRVIRRSAIGVEAGWRLTGSIATFQGDDRTVGNFLAFSARLVGTVRASARI